MTRYQISCVCCACVYICTSSNVQQMLHVLVIIFTEQWFRLCAVFFPQCCASLPPSLQKEDILCLCCLSQKVSVFGSTHAHTRSEHHQHLNLRCTFTLDRGSGSLIFAKKNNVVSSGAREQRNIDPASESVSLLDFYTVPRKALHRMWHLPIHYFPSLFLSNETILHSAHLQIIIVIFKRNWTFWSSIFKQMCNVFLSFTPCFLPGCAWWCKIV